MSEANGTPEVELDAKQGKLRVRGSDILTTLGITAVFLVGYMVYEHKEESRIIQQTFVGAVKEMTIAQKEGVQVQRVMNCLITLPPERRESGLSTCERISR